MGFDAHREKNTYHVEGRRSEFEKPGHAVACPGLEFYELECQAQAEPELPLVVLGTGDFEEVATVDVVI